MAIYYISPTGHDDTGDGTQGNPWATPGYAISQCSSGDTVYASNGNYTISSSIVLPTGISIQGQSTSVIFYSTVVGTRGGTGISNPTFDMTSPTEGTNGNQSITNITLDGSDLVAGGAFMIRKRSNITFDGVVIRDFYLNGITLMGSADSDAEPTTYSTGNTITGCTITNCGDTPGTWDGGGLIQPSGQDTLVISYCTLTNNERATGHNGNILNAGHWNKNVKYHHNISTKPYTETAWNFHLECMDSRGGWEVYENESYGGDVFFDIAWATWEKGIYDYSVSIHDNYIYDNPTVHSDHGKNAIDIEPDNGADIYIYNNHFEGCVTTIGASDNTFQHNNWNNIHIYNNIMENCGYNNPTDYVNVMSFLLAGSTSTMTNLFIYNNVCESNSYKHTTALKFQTATGSGMSNLKIKNNIITNHQNGTFMNVVNNGSINILNVDYNLLYDNANSNNPTFSGNAVTNYTFNNNNQGSDPLFVSSTNFHLQRTSPAVGTGTNVSIVTDYEGDSWRAVPSKGALEYDAVTFYVKNGGSDSADGLSDATAWETVAKVSTTTFYEGESILFKCGSTWYDDLTITSSGVIDGRITYGNYSTGTLPKFDGRRDLPGWSISGNWTNISGNIWTISWSGGYDVTDRIRIWINGTEVKRSETSSVTSDYRFYPANGTFYLYNVGNPSGNSSIDLVDEDNGLFNSTLSKNYITFSGLDIQGWYYMQFTTCSYLRFEDCSIGENFGLYGLRFTGSDHGIITGCTINAHDMLNHSWRARITEDGIRIDDGCDDWDIYNNDLMYWGHSGLYLLSANPPTAAITNIKFHDNYYTNAGADYGRCFNVDVEHGYSTGNELYNNLVEDQATASQIQGEYIKVYNNIFNRCSGDEFTSGRPHDNAHALTIVGYYTYNSPQHMEIFNNVFANCYGHGLFIHNSSADFQTISDNLIDNNIFYHNEGINVWLGSGSTYVQVYIEDGLPGSNIYNNTYRNNIFYTPDIATPIIYGPYGLTKITATTFNTAEENGDVILGNIQGDPDFTNPDLDFHIDSLSPAYHAGIYKYGGTDMDGNLWNNPPSIGALEFDAETAVGIINAAFAKYSVV